MNVLVILAIFLISNIQYNIVMLTKYFDTERFIHSLKTVFACMIGFIIAELIGFTSGQWIVITIIIVMCAQIYVGSVLQKAYFRFLGTFIGCLFAAFALALFSNNDLTAALTISLSSFVFSYIATSRESLVYTGTLGAVTTAIVLLSPGPTVFLAFERFIEIGVGILIATLVSQFILPIHARKHLRTAQAKTLTHLRDYYRKAIMEPLQNSREENYHEMDENVVKSLLTQRQLANESKHEPLGKTFNAAHFMQTLHYEKEILRAINFMQCARSQVKETGAELPAIHHFNEAIMQTFNTLIQLLESEKDNHPLDHFPDLALFKIALLHNIDKSTQETRISIEAFIFSAEILVTSLMKLTGLYRAHQWI